MSRKVNMEKLLINGRNLIAAEALCNEIGNAKKRILDDKLVPRLEEFAEKEGLSLDSDTVCSKRFSGFYFEPSSWNEKYNIGFEFQQQNYTNLIYGIHLTDADEPSTSEKEQEELHQLFSNTSKKNKSKWWPWWAAFEYNNWTSDIFINIYKNPKAMAKLIINKTRVILKKIGNC